MSDTRKKEISIEEQIQKDDLLWLEQRLKDIQKLQKSSTSFFSRSGEKKAIDDAVKQFSKELKDLLPTIDGVNQRIKSLQSAVEYGQMKQQDVNNQISQLDKQNKINAAFNAGLHSLEKIYNDFSGNKSKTPYANVVGTTLKSIYQSYKDNVQPGEGMLQKVATSNTHYKFTDQKTPKDSRLYNQNQFENAYTFTPTKK